MKVTLTKVTRTERVSQKTGKPFTSLSIKTIEHGDKFLSGFGNKDNSDWREGSQVEIETTEVAKDGKVYLNFTTPKKEEKEGVDTERILNAIAGLKIELNSVSLKLDRVIKGPAEDSYPEYEEPLV